MLRRQPAGRSLQPARSAEQVAARYPLPPPSRRPQPPAQPPLSRRPQSLSAAAGHVQQPPCQRRPADRLHDARPPALRPPPDRAFQPTQIVATVGSEFIFYGDVAATVEQILEPAVAASRRPMSTAQELEKVREPLTRQMLGQMINTKMMYLEFVREIEKNAGRDKLPEAAKEHRIERCARSFEKELTAMREQIAKAKPTEIQKLLKRDPIVPRLAVLMRDNQAESLQRARHRFCGSTARRSTSRFALYGEDRARHATRSAGRSFTDAEVTPSGDARLLPEHAADYARAGQGPL